MPVTAKLSLAFYDRLGHPVADEMVEWFNQVDASSRNELREINELNFARFDAKMEQRFAEMRVEMKEQQFTLIRWMVSMWMVQLAAIMGLWMRR
jgi:hypothetical protein